ncbi:MAG: hypothetical protein IKD31_01305 [Clostridia bacterium]|nr:hypothetical protein [Clostridia bacterium]
MLGYVRCEEGELKVKHQRLYRAVYCGLCHSARVHRARCLLPLFRYDFVFLALMRMLAFSDEIRFEKNFCLLHPFRKKSLRLADNASLRYTVFAACVLIWEKLKDDLTDGDVSFFRRLLCRWEARFFGRAVKKMCRRTPSYAPLPQRIARILEEGRALEKNGAELDDMCENFASCMAEIASFGAEGREKTLLHGVGDLLGRAIYTLDALEDVPKDQKSGAFNPLLKNEDPLSKENLCRLDLVFSFYIEQMKQILILFEGDPALSALCENIIGLGLPGAARKIFQPKNGEVQ